MLKEKNLTTPKEKLDWSKEKQFLYKFDNTLQTKKQIAVLEIPGEDQSNVAYTTLKEIYLNFEKVKTIAEENYSRFLIFTKAFNYHEMCHILFTRAGRMDYRVRHQFNVLEDQRIENIFVNLYPSSKHYFKMISSYIMSENKTDSFIYFLLYGRRFIIEDDLLLGKFRNLSLKTMNETKVNMGETIIDEYLIATDVRRQIELAKQFKELFAFAENPLSHGRTHGQGKSKVGKEEEKGTAEIVEKQKKGKPIQSQSANPLDRKQEAKDYGKNAQEQVKEEIEKQMQDMDKHGFYPDENFSNNSRLIFTPEPQHEKVAEELRQSIRYIRNELDCRTVYNQKRGKINMRKAMMNDDSYKVQDFKRYVPSRLKKTKIAATIIIDSSGSMQDNNFDVAISGGWAVAKALEKLGSLCQVIEFSDQYRIMKSFATSVKEAQWGRNYSGSTSVLPALKQAEKDLKTLQVKGYNNRMVMVFTDGYFGDNGETEAFTRKLKIAQTYVMLFKTNCSLNNDKNSYTKIFHVQKFEQLPALMVEAVKEVQADVVRKIQQG